MQILRHIFLEIFIGIVLSCSSIDSCFIKFWITDFFSTFINDLVFFSVSNLLLSVLEIVGFSSCCIFEIFYLLEKYLLFSCT